DRNVKTLANDALFPLIVTPSYKEIDIPVLQEDMEGFLSMSTNSVLPVGIVLSPKNAALAALRMSGLGNEQLSTKMKQYQEKIRNQYRTQ
ncbi:MAG: hypothetical protein MUP55_04155, partial [Candidatus Aenigmarchaeota archaeon]|nr:hypothetical protein [Candidatus Aenigmarchaeota archaeon]